jgi:hypothetical protein
MSHSPEANLLAPSIEPPADKLLKSYIPSNGGQSSPKLTASEKCYGLGELVHNILDICGKEGYRTFSIG